MGSRLLEEQDKRQNPQMTGLAQKNGETFRNPKLLIRFLAFPVIKPLELNALQLFSAVLTAGGSFLSI